jgi:hypothetical protein
MGKDGSQQSDESEGDLHDRCRQVDLKKRKQFFI